MPTAVYAAASNKRKRDAAASKDAEEDISEGVNGGASSFVDDDEDDEDSEEDDEEDDEESEVDDEAEMSVFKDVLGGKGKGRALAEQNGEKRTVFKQKTLILSSRGITHRMRHMMKDLGALLPHSKTDSKLDTKHQLSLLNELADLSNCSSALFFEARRHADLYLWASLTPNGPSVRFHLLNAHTMDELKMTGNCLKGSRPIVVFDSTFDQSAHWRLIKEVMMQIFAVPKTARRAKPFVDHVTSFSVADGRVWFRNYQIIENAPLDLVQDAIEAEAARTGAKAEGQKKPKKLSKNAEENLSMNEIGPRFVLTPVKIFEGSFGGAVVWENKEFVTPTAKLAGQKLEQANKYRERKDQQTEKKGRTAFLAEQQEQERETSGKAALDRSRVFA